MRNYNLFSNNVKCSTISTHMYVWMHVYVGTCVYKGVAIMVEIEQIYNFKPLIFYFCL